MAISETEAPRRPSGSVGPIPVQLGRYEVIDRLAVGGMAEVFACYERAVGGLERLAVVKRILPQLAAQEAFVSMFLAEARYVARLNHPNVVQVFELAEDEHGTPFLAMEYIAGSSAREVIVAAIEAHQRVPVGAAVGIAVQACAGAHAAHELTDPKGRPLGLVHRDISPHNLMITSNGHVKLLDFGIAKATEAVEGADATRTGGLKGKVHYMSPEQCKQEALDRRTDVFALGVVLWETLASDRLFKRKSELESLHAIINGERRDLRELRADVPKCVHEILARALSADKEARHPTAEALRKELLEACASEGLTCTADDVAAFVRPLLGDAQRRREAELRHRARHEPGEPVLPPRASPDAVTSAQQVDPTLVLSSPPSKRGVWVAGALAAVGLALGVAVGGADHVMGPSGPPLTMAFAPTADAKLMMEDVESLRAWLSTSLDRPVTFTVADSYADLQSRVLEGAVEVASMPPYLLVETQARAPELAVIATKEVQGSTGNDSILYVLDTSPVTRIAELRGLRLCYPDDKSTTGYLFMRLALRRAGLDPNVDVKLHRSGSHLQALRDVVAEKCDATATYSGGFLGADRAGVPVARLRQLAIIARAPHQAIVVPAKVPAEERAKIQRAFLAYDPEDGGKNGRVERISGFSEPNLDDYAAVKEALLEGRSD